jgi:ubiquinone/menaquinone biosynthesis C-methylase UbiE
MPSFEEIYARHADLYDALVEREDHQRHLLPALLETAQLEGADVVEFGAGSGRLTRLLVPVAGHVSAYDASAHMLSVADAHLRATGLANWELGVADNKRLPVDDAAADIAISGWSFGHAVGWFPAAWRTEIGAAVDEMERVLRPGGTAIILETLTTGSETPAPPTPGLAAYYRWLEIERSFSVTAIRTDFRFESLAEAEHLTRFFFGDELADKVRREHWIILPENTGIWWRKSA